jgi:GT2 family glycosyltransferase
MKKLTVIVLNMNGLENLKILFDSLRRQTYRGFDVVVSDNGSTDGSIEWLRKNRIKFLSNGKNLGFSGGNNVALKKVKTKYVGIFNDDIRLEPNVIKTLVEFMDATPDAGSVQPKIVGWDGKAVQSTGLVLTYGGFPAERDKYKVFVREVKRPEEVRATHGCCSVYRTAVFRKIGFFDEWFNPIYNEDFDAGLKIMKAGYKNYYHPVPVVYHRGGFTSKKLKYMVRLSFHRNRYKLLQNHATKRMWLEAAAWTPIVGGFYLIRKPEPAFFQALFEFLTGQIRRPVKKRK